MTVTWIDTPGVALGSKADSVDFTTSADVVAISVAVGPLPEERVYRDGSFLPGFTTSTRTVNTFALRRRGGWPKVIDPQTSKPYPVTVYVDEVPAPVTSLWTTLYEVDMTAQGSQSIDSAITTTAVIDGQTWSFGATSGTPGRDLTSSGLRISFEGASNWPTTASWGYLDLSQLAGYDATKQHAVLARLTSESVNFTSRSLGAGLWAPASRATSHLTAGFSTDQITIQYGLAAGSGAIADVEPAATFGAVPDSLVFGVARTDSTRGYGFWAPFSETLPNVEDGRIIAGVAARGYTSDTGWAGGFYAAGGNSNTTLRLTHFKVVQR